MAALLFSIVFSALWEFTAKLYYAVRNISLNTNLLVVNLGAKLVYSIIFIPAVKSKLI